MATTADLRNAALQHLGVLAAGESATSEDAALVDRIAGNAIDGLIHDGFHIDSTAIPDEVFEPLKEYVANMAAKPFEKPVDKEEMMRAEIRVRGRLSMRNPPESHPAKYF